MPRLMMKYRVVTVSVVMLLEKTVGDFSLVEVWHVKRSEGNEEMD